MGVAGEHVDALDVVARDFKLKDFICPQFTLLYQAVTGDHNEELPLGVVPVLAFGDAGLGDVDGYLTGRSGDGSLIILPLFNLLITP